MKNGSERGYVIYERSACIISCCCVINYQLGASLVLTGLTHAWGQPRVRQQAALLNLPVFSPMFVVGWHLDGLSCNIWTSLHVCSLSQTTYFLCHIFDQVTNPLPIHGVEKQTLPPNRKMGKVITDHYGKKKIENMGNLKQYHREHTHFHYQVFVVNILLYLLYHASAHLFIFYSYNILI